jgi:transcriptional regulator with XRE-family HTH domain
METVGQYISRVRNKNNISIGKLAKMAGDVSGSEIHNIETGKRLEPNPRILAKIGKALGVSCVELMYRAGYIKKEDLNCANLHDCIDLSGFSPELRGEVREFIQFLMTRQKELK